VTRVRWALLVLAVLAGLAGGWLVSRGPNDPAALEPAAVAALPLNLPAPSSAGSGPSTAPLSTAAGPAKAASTTPAAVPRIGSEGYGPHIERAQAGNEPAAAWEAVQWMRNCATTEHRRHSFERARNMGVAPEMMTQMMQEADDEGRRCQTVTAQHRALLPELAARAMRAGVPEAAAAYANATFPNDLTPAQRQEVVDAMRRDAQSADALSLLGALTANEAWGLSDAEKLAYLAAYISLPDQPGNKTMAKALVDHGTIRFKTPPTAEQLEAVKPAVQQILERVRAAKP
jgi:hypothetical protein